MSERSRWLANANLLGCNFKGKGDIMNCSCNGPMKRLYYYGIMIFIILVLLYLLLLCLLWWWKRWKKKSYVEYCLSVKCNVVLQNERNEQLMLCLP